MKNSDPKGYEGIILLVSMALIGIIIAWVGLTNGT